MPILWGNQLRRLGIAVFKAAGVPEEEARLVTGYLVEANLVGYDSHGIMRIPGYVRGIKEGRIKPGTEIEVVGETPSSAVVNGNGGLGQVVAAKCMEIAIKKAETHTVGCAVAHNLGHIGRLSDYSIMAMDRGMIGVTMQGGLGRVVAPYGGVEGRLSTNPICVAIPAGDEAPFVMDYATSVAAEGKVRDKLHRGAKVPDGWIIDKEGRPSNNPADLYDGGALLPFGGMVGYKATALGIVAMLGGILSGAPEKRMMGAMFTAINIKDFMLVTEFKKRMGEAIRRIKSSKPAPGMREVLTPGEPEIEAKKIRTRKGIDVPDTVWRDIVDTAKELKVDVDKLIKQK